MAAENIKLIAVTAEPGGDQAVRDRLAERGCADLKFDVKSDPDHTLLIDEDIYVKKPHEWDVSGNYDMVQPAIVVMDQDGNPVKECLWSWKTMGYENGSEMDLIPYEDQGSFPLVVYRPVISDLVSSIKEKRPIKLAPTKF